MVIAGANGARHCAQNLAVDLLLAPQLGQFIIYSVLKTNVICPKRTVESSFNALVLT